MIIVGSRCGGFDFFAQKIKEKEMIWLGPRQDSDFDVYCEKKELINIDFKKVDFRPIKNFKSNIYLGCEFPFKENEKLYLPQDLTYLSKAIKKKLKFTTEEFLKLIGQEFNIFNNDKIFVTTIKFKFFSLASSSA